MKKERGRHSFVIESFFILTDFVPKKFQIDFFGEDCVSMHSMHSSNIRISKILNEFVQKPAKYVKRFLSQEIFPQTLKSLFFIVS